jgi:hypothetical protein
MTIHIDVASGGSVEMGWSATVIPDAAETSARPGTARKLHSWTELDALANECDVPGAQITGRGLLEMRDALGEHSA